MTDEQMVGVCLGLGGKGGAAPEARRHRSMQLPHTYGTLWLFVNVLLLVVIQRKRERERDSHAVLPTQGLDMMAQVHWEAKQLDNLADDVQAMKVCT